MTARGNLVHFGSPEGTTYEQPASGSLVHFGQPDSTDKP